MIINKNDLESGKCDKEILREIKILVDNAISEEFKAISLKFSIRKISIGGYI